MKKNDFTQVSLSKGEMRVYDFGGVKLHAYQTNDFLSDEVFLIEKGGRIIVVEQPCFNDNIKELTDYINSLNCTVEGKVLSYHAAGASFFPNAKVYSTKNADGYGHSGGGKTLIDNFAATFGEIFDASISATTDYINEGSVNIGGVKMTILETPDAFDIEIPEINSIYIHMLGNDCHSIVAGNEHADTIIRQLNGCNKKGYNLILTSHYVPEDLKDAQIKISYLEDIKKIAANSKNADEFKKKVMDKYIGYSGENYLDMTAGFFFP